MSAFLNDNNRIELKGIEVVKFIIELEGYCAFNWQYATVKRILSAYCLAYQYRFG
jgi:hypothetical protein